MSIIPLGQSAFRPIHDSGITEMSTTCNCLSARSNSAARIHPVVTGTEKMSAILPPSPSLMGEGAGRRVPIRCWDQSSRSPIVELRTLSRHSRAPSIELSKVPPNATDEPYETQRVQLFAPETPLPRSSSSEIPPDSTLKSDQSIFTSLSPSPNSSDDRNSPIPPIKAKLKKSVTFSALEGSRFSPTTSGDEYRLSEITNHFIQGRFGSRTNVIVCNSPILGSAASSVRRIKELFKTPQ